MWKKLTVLTLLLTAACTSPETVRIGYVGPLTGNAAALGQTEQRAVEMAVEHVNTNGGIDGRPVEVLYRDGQCSGTTAATAARSLLANNVSAILGGLCSDETLAVAPITEREDVLLLTGMSSHPNVTGQGDHVFRFIASDTDLPRAQAQYFYHQGYRNVSILTQQTAYCSSASVSFRDEFERLGGTVAETVAVQSGDYRSATAKLPTDTVVVIPQSPKTAGVMAKQLREQKPNVTVLGSWPMESDDAIQAAQGALDGALVYSYASTYPSGGAVLDRYEKRFGTPAQPFAVLESWDRVHVLAEVGRQCDLDTDCMSEYLYGNTFNLSLGTYGFDGRGDITTFYTGVYRVVNGSARAVEPVITQ